MLFGEKGRERKKEKHGYERETLGALAGSERGRVLWRSWSQAEVKAGRAQPDLSASTSDEPFYLSNSEERRRPSYSTRWCWGSDLNNRSLSNRSNTTFFL